MSRSFQVIPATCPVHWGVQEEWSPLRILIHNMMCFVVRRESCFSIIEKALLKARRILRTLDFDHDIRMMRRAEHLKPLAFSQLLTQRLMPQNSLSRETEALVA